jgi:ABC-type molybdenum transport system ATPase subunit/photorepair protein PhrA
MFNSVSFENFRGLNNINVSLSQLTMLTGTNGVGKTTVLEGLYCLFSQSKLDVSPLSRYAKTSKLTINQNGNIGAAPAYDYKLFWNECPSYGNTECSVTAKSDSEKWCWRYKKANVDDIKNLINFQPFSISTNTEFAKWQWSISQGTDNKEFSKAQIITDDGTLQLIPLNSVVHISFFSDCLYIDFPLIRVSPETLTLGMSKELTNAIKPLCSRVTDVRLAGLNKGFSVVLDGEKEASLGTLGNGTVTWASTVHAILELMDDCWYNDRQSSAPLFILIDEFGAGIHYSAMLSIWGYIKTFAEENPNIQFVFTSHSKDCIQAYCETFSESENAKIVRFHKNAHDDGIETTEYEKEYFPKIIDDEWEVRG